MIAFLAGEIAAKSATGLVIDVGGVGYAVSVSTRTLASVGSVGDETLIHTYMQVRENEVALFGFLEPEERDAFLALINVSGIGPKVALAILSTLSPTVLARAVSAEDVATLSSVSGVGKKMAQRLALELKGKIGAFIGGDVLVTSDEDAALVSEENKALSEAQAALFSMGFTPTEVSEALTGVAADASSSEVLKFALHKLGGGRS